MNDNILRKELLGTLNGGNAHVTFEQAVNNVNPELRNKRPADDIHSVWELLEHLRISQEDILRYMVDPGWKSPKWPDEYWPDKKSTIVNDEMWNESIKKFSSDLEEIISIVNDNKTDLTSVIPHTENHTYLREILLVVNHNSYHIGQIAETRKLLGNW
ncbi:MAG: DinB family protein [Ignavibacteriaceae bacterium]